MLIGRVEGEMEVRQTPTGRPVASFTIGTPRSWATPDGEHHEELEWFNIVAWGQLAEICQQKLIAGTQLYVEGRLQTRGWEDSNGRRHFRTEVVAQEMIVLSES